MAILSLVLQSLLVLYFTFSGISKVIGVKYWVGIFKQIKLPQWFRVVTGIVQLIGVAMLITGYWIIEVLVLAGIWLGITMLIACLAHVRIKDTIGKTMPAFVFFVLITILVIINADYLPALFQSAAFGK
ncbi:DoxX family protein [Thalassobacillus pellis]|uniref:DoxX family protein n=1 Tax=Thalassobacillus pellis TaxID=748008 RepID=UPI001960C408|nr:DoxX family protein [Thalassobacillus pellis]MBM7553895.1 putative membrane protein YphA (DoxX/SURF4 family) [Thalassobacillus pellis]